MSRDYPDRYREYKQLAISRETERVWTFDALKKLSTELRDTATKKGDLWRLHSRMEDLARSLKTEDALQQIYEATECILDRLPGRSKLLVAETIHGRGAIEFRRGLIFLARELNKEDLVQRFLEISTTLITSTKSAGIEVERCDRV